MSNIRVLISAESRLFREGLKQICEDAGYEIAEIGTVQDIKESAYRTKPDIILMDADVPLPNRIQMISGITEKIPNTKIILLTDSFQEEPVFEAVKAGAWGCLSKDISARELTEQIKAAYGEEPWISAGIADRIIEEFSRFNQKIALTKNAEILTQDEMELLKMKADCFHQPDKDVTELLNEVIRKLRANIDIFA